MIKIITVGKLKEKYLIDAIEEYKKRLSKYIKLEIIEVLDESNYEQEKIREKESEKIEKIFNINSNITFVIGGSYGLADSIKNKANYKLSFSKMTFPHQLFRVILLEQIYRSFKINNNESYHK